MQIPTWRSIANIARAGIWYFSGPLFLKSTITIGATVSFSKGVSTGTIVAASVIFASALGFLMLRRASLRQIGGHFLLVSIFFPVYYFGLWLLSYTAPLISGAEIPGAHIFLTFANPLHHGNLLMILLAVPFALTPVATSKLFVLKRIQ